LSGKCVVRKTSVGESDCPGNVCKAASLGYEMMLGYDYETMTSPSLGYEMMLGYETMTSPSLGYFMSMLGYETMTSPSLGYFMSWVKSSKKNLTVTMPRSISVPN